MTSPTSWPVPPSYSAARLWDGALAVVTTPGFYEIKRGRTVGPLFD